MVYIKVKNNIRHNELIRKCNLYDKNGTVCDYVCMKKNIMINHINCNKHKMNGQISEVKIIEQHASKLGIYINRLSIITIYLDSQHNYINNKRKAEEQNEIEENSVFDSNFINDLMEIPLKLLNVNTKHLTYTEIKLPPLITVKQLELYYFEHFNVRDIYIHYIFTVYIVKVLFCRSIKLLC